MNKKFIYGLVIVLFVIIVALIIFFLVRGSKQTVSLDLQQLNTTISEKSPFDVMASMDITKEVLQTSYDINPDDVEEVIGKMPMMNVQASMYLIIKAKDGSVDTVKQKVDEYASTREKIWSTYLPDQYDLVLQRKTGVVGNYVYLFISENSAEIESLIK